MAIRTSESHVLAALCGVDGATIEWHERYYGQSRIADGDITSQAALDKALGDAGGACARVQARAQ